MKKLAFFMLVFYGCSSSAVDMAAPSGEEVFRLLLNSGDMALKDEPLCNVLSTTKSGPLHLSDQLATILSTSYNTENINTFSSTCSKSKHEFENGKVVGIWDCTLQVLESSTNVEFISSSTLAFGLSMDKTKLLPGTIRCL